MSLLHKIHHGLNESLFSGFIRQTDGWLLGTSARLVFASTLLLYFWNSALTKLGDGLSVSDGAYAQILPKAYENAGYDTAALNWYHDLIVVAGTLGEIVLPLLIIVGLFTRPAALGFIGFIAVMSYVDIVGHGADATAIGAFFDRISDSAIADQRLFWVFLMLVLVVKGAGTLSLDRLLSRRYRSE